ncbi:protoheme IX farnesyltransferase [Achromatium sp. WMS3]|nr:protoheme IX farnesyltransferase [Achromatium sp. WMS3]
MAVSECDFRNTQDFDWRRYIDLTKPKVVMLIVFTALVGMLLSSPGMIPFTTLIFGLVGIGLAAAAGAALNQIIDQKIDAIMDRTHKRPLPTGDIDAPHAIYFAVTLIILAMLVLGFLVNVLTMILSLSAFIGYAVIYTIYLKRSTPQNIVWGGIAGALPPLLGWTAATGELAYEPIILVALIFVWTPPHFWALAIKRRKEYAQAGIPMLPVTHGVNHTKKQILIYSMVLFAVSLGPYVIGMNGLIYLVGAVGLGLKFLYHTIKLFQTDGDAQAMPTFVYSIMYLSTLFAVLLVDHYGRYLWIYYFS